MKFSEIDCVFFIISTAKPGGTPLIPYHDAVFHRRSKILHPNLRIPAKSGFTKQYPIEARRETNERQGGVWELHRNKNEKKQKKGVDS